MRAKVALKMMGLCTALFFVNLALKLLYGAKRVCEKGKEWCERWENRKLTEK